MKSFICFCITALLYCTWNILALTYNTRFCGYIFLQWFPIALTRCVFPHPDGPNMNIGLNCVPCGCSAIDSPTERESLLLAPSMNVRNVWLGLSWESIGGRFPDT